MKRLTNVPRAAARVAGAWLSRQPKAVIAVASFVLVALVAAADIATGDEIAVSLFYLAPVGLAAWFGGQGMGLAFSVLATAAWIALDKFSGKDPTNLVHEWNGAIRLGFFVVTAVLLHRLHRAFRQLDELARTDSLTNLPNRRAFLEQLEFEIARSRRTGHRFALAFFDLDGFKQVNDRHGHAEGDRVLVAVARAAESGLRPADLAARLGGDEFAVLFSETALDEAAAVLEDIHARVRRAMAAGGWATDMSAGVVAFEVPPSSPEQALVLADELAREAKAAGKGRACYAATGAGITSAARLPR